MGYAKAKDMKKPNFFIVGAPKSGTTAMNEYLKQHTDIFIPPGKEFHFFGSDLQKSPQKYIHDINTYLSLFTKARDEKRIGEASTFYLYSKNAPAEIKEFNSSARIIIMLRNPVDMIYAFHSQLLYGGFENIPNFRAALDAENERKQGLRIPRGAHLVNALFYRDLAQYTQHVQRYFEVFGQENVHVIIFDDFKKDTADVYRKMLRFLQVNEDFQPDFGVINPNKRVRSKILQNFLLSPPQIVQLLMSAVIPRSLSERLVEKLKLLNTKYEPRPPMDFELRKRLQEEFAPEVERLSELLGRDLTHWSRA